MKLEWAVLLGVGLAIGQAEAAQSVVIDNQAIDKQAGTAKQAPGASTSAAKQNAVTDENNANKQRLLKGGRLSPREKHELAKAAAADRNKQEGENFLSTNAAKKGVVSLASGVQYRILRAGKGPKPTENSWVKCHLKGQLIDNSVFEKHDQKKLDLMHVKGFVPGLQEAVKMMPAGSKWEIVVPPQLGYGAVGNRGVAPNAVLIYQMEILSIQNKR